VLALFVEAPFRVDGDDDALVAEGARALGDEVGVRDGAGVDGDFVRARSGVSLTSSSPDAPPTVSGMNTSSATAETVSSIVSRPSAGGDVEEDELVGARLVVLSGHLDGVTGVGQVLEVDAGVDGGVPVLVQVDVDTGG